LGQRTIRALAAFDNLEETGEAKCEEGKNPVQSKIGAGTSLV
jgi:hypothetical protein